MSNPYEYNIELENGKYSMVLTNDYKVQYLRGGEVWVEDPPAPKMLISFMDKFEQLECQLKEAKELLDYAQDVLGNVHLDDSEVYQEISTFLDKGEWGMLNFVNTEIVEDGRHIGVAVYYINFEKASDLIDELLKYENVVRERRSQKEREVIIDKNGYEVVLKTLPMSESTRGNKHHYSFIDKYSFSDEYGLEFLNTRILTSTVDYNMKDEYKFKGHYEPRLLLY